MPGDMADANEEAKLKMKFSVKPSKLSPGQHNTVTSDALSPCATCHVHVHSHHVSSHQCKCLHTFSEQFHATLKILGRSSSPCNLGICFG